ncbi:MAG: hypothetical protein M3O03_01885 [Pseudomonadota bacterium]|nr:hypothetical protein [Pseudomonadota bacterium]
MTTLTDKWTNGYSKAEIDAAQEKFDLQFPPDLVDLLLDRRPKDGHDWRDEVAIRRMLNWPFEMLLFDVEHNGLWWPEWGPKPLAPEDRKGALRHVLMQAPRLIPLYSHRFLPETPSEVGNPVFSVYGADSIIYGANLEDYFQREFSHSGKALLPEDVKHISFWSKLVDRNY